MHSCICITNSWRVQEKLTNVDSLCVGPEHWAHGEERQSNTHTCPHREVWVVYCLLKWNWKLIWISLVPSSCLSKAFPKQLLCRGDRDVSLPWESRCCGRSLTRAGWGQVRQGPHRAVEHGLCQLGEGTISPCSCWLSGLPAAWASCGCQNKAPQTYGLKQHRPTLLKPGGQKSKMQCWGCSWRRSGRTHFLTFSSC